MKTVRAKLFGSVGTSWLAGALIGGLAFSSPAFAQSLGQEFDSLTAAVTGGGKARVIVEYKANVPAPAEAAGFGELATRGARLNAAHASFLSSVGRSMADADVTVMPLTPQVAMTVSAAELANLRSNPMVASVQPDRLSRPMLNDSTALVNANYAWSSSATGLGWSVAVLDTGSNVAHEFLARGGASEACYGTRTSFMSSGRVVNVTPLCPGGATQSTAAGSARDCNRNQITGCGHGTHVAGIAVGRNTSPSPGEPARGMAYQSSLIAINVFSQFSRNYCGDIGYPSSRPCVLSYSSDQIKGLQRVLALSIAGRKIAAVNMSLGGGQFFSTCNSDPLRPTITALRNRKIATVIAAGNSGFPNAVGAPGCISAAITVAASTKSDAFAFYTNYSSVVDIIAPGSDIRSSSRTSSNTSRYYVPLSGTSMAAPHVAGLFAMMKDRYPSATVSQIESAMKACGPLFSKSGVSRRRLDAQCIYIRLDAVLP